MDFGKFLAILGGLLTTVALFFLTLFEVAGTPPLYSYAIGGYISLNAVIVNAATNASILHVDVWVIYLLLGAYVIFTTTGFMQLGGASSRISAFIGSIIPLAIGVILILNVFTGILAEVPAVMTMFVGEDLVTNIPFHYVLGGVALGVWIMTGGSLLTFISVFIKRHHEKE